MPALEHLDREQLEKLDKETLIDLLLLALQRIDQLEKQAASQVVLIQKLQDELAKNSRSQVFPDFGAEASQIIPPIRDNIS